MNTLICTTFMLPSCNHSCGVFTIFFFLFSIDLASEFLFLLFSPLSLFLFLVLSTGVIFFFFFFFESLEKLARVDPVSAAKLCRNDYFRLVRALEIYRQTGKPKSSFQLISKERLLPFDIRPFFITLPRMELFRTLDLRCEKIIHEGLFQEVWSNFFLPYLDPKSPLFKGKIPENLDIFFSDFPCSARAIGYTEVIKFLWEFLNLVYQENSHARGFCDYPNDSHLKRLEPNFRSFFGLFPVSHQTVGQTSTELGTKS
eukprot:TRINITY_DN8160_c0_g1_i6.p1 TRINITY_DN8160_c0_g1~~TRINITY_DN8160_c0_g1_i6.p1  ORF type:complete len:257 (-),score=36.25 TRINITY_DN8160_c0_g1_i6:455-1225(-)